MKKIYKRTLPYLIISAALVFLSSSCSTVRGAGRDVEKMGNSIQRSSR